jgi:rhomboid protease GluP
VIIELQRAGHIQRLLYEDFETRVRDGEIPPELPIRFDAVTGDRFVPAGQLEFYRELVDPKRREFRSKLIGRGVPLATAILVGIQIRIYLSSWAPGIEDTLQTDFTNWAPAVLEQGEVHRLISYGLLHIGFTHLLFNLTFLAYTGYNLERALGRANLLLLYFGSVFAGGTLSMFMAPERPSLGASGGDFGLIAAAVVFGWKHWDDIPNSARTKFGWALAPYLGFSLISGLSAENVDNWGHLGGLVAGAILMTLLAPEISEQASLRNRRIRRGSTALMCAIAFGLLSMGENLIQLKARSDGNWTVPVPGYWREGWTFTGDRGWFSPTGDATMVVARTVHDRPIDPLHAAELLLSRVNSGASDVRQTNQQVVTIGGTEGTASRIEFSLANEPQVMWAIVLTRGVVSHRAIVQARKEVAHRYDGLLDRALNDATLEEPAELQLALERSATHPRSWQPAIELGDALYRAGHPQRALEAYEKALTKVPERTEALVGRLRVFTHYRLPGGRDAAMAAIAEPDRDARVTVAAADLLDSLGDTQEVRDALNAAWTALPGNGILRRARLQRSLAVDE